MDVRKLKNF